MSAPGAYHVPLIVVEQYVGLYEVLQGGAHLVEREVRSEARAQMSPQRSRMRTAPRQDFPRFFLSFPLLGNPNPPGRQGCMWPHYFTLALHGITDDWGECRRLESTAEGEFWCGEQTRQIVYF